MTQAPEDLAETPNQAFEPARGRDDPLSEVLNIVHVKGETALVLAPDKPQTITFPEVAPSLFFVERGEVTLHVDDAPGITLKQMQLALLLHRPAREIRFQGGGERRALAEIAESPGPSDSDRALRCFWGAFSFDGALAARVLRTLPPVIVLTDLEQNPSQLLEMCCNLILMEIQAGQPGANVMVSRLLDPFLIPGLRRWAHSVGDAPSWLAAAQEDRNARALGALHREPPQKW
ncbi:MAG: cupin domain-containing protein, partial [Arenibacterium sp.]